MADRIQTRRDTAANWTATNPILADGEFGLETNTFNGKYGDGATAWNSLPYFFYTSTSLLDHLNDTSDAHDASAISNVPAGNIAATNVQDAINELDSEKEKSINAATAKTTPVDADFFGLIDSAASNILKKLSWANIKATLKAYFDGIYTTQSSYKNKIIGGDFTTNPWQRGTSFTASAGIYMADRFSAGAANTTTAVLSGLKTADAPTAAQAGVYTQHCLHLDVTTADTSIAAGDLYVISQVIEGLNSASFGFGQAGTRNVTLSFWHKHTKTGVHCASIRNSAGDRSYVAEYTQDVTNTWERAEITIPVDTTGTWLYDNGVGLRVAFALAAGTNFHTSENAWVAGNFSATANQVNNLDNIANNFKIALVQLEAGSTATAFETRSVGQEKSLCDRYTKPIRMSLSVYGLTANGTSYTQTIEPMRATPTVTNQVNTVNSNSSGSTFTPVDSSSITFGFTITAAGNGSAQSTALLVAEL